MPDIQAVELTEEMKAKLKGFLGFQVEASFEYVPKAYRNPDNAIPREAWPVFTLKAKDGLELVREQDDVEMVLDRDTKQSRMVMSPGTARLRTLRRGLLAVRGLFIAGSKDIPDGRIAWDGKARDLVITKSTGEHVRTRNNTDVDKVIAFMPVALQMELETAINERDVLAPEELRGLG